MDRGGQSGTRPPHISASPRVESALQRPLSVGVALVKTAIRVCCLHFVVRQQNKAKLRSYLASSARETTCVCTNVLADY